MVFVLPVLLVALYWMGNTRTDALLTVLAASKLASAHNYLDQLKNETGIRISQLTQSERLLGALFQDSNHEALGRFLAATARSNGLDFLIAATPEGHVLGSSTAPPHFSRLPDLHSLRQASLGLSTASYERLSSEDLAKLSIVLHRKKTGGPAESEKDSEVSKAAALLIISAAHLPLSTSYPDTVLIGGVLLNGNVAMIERMRNVIFPLESGFVESRGQTSIFVEDTLINSTFRGAPGNTAIRVETPLRPSATYGLSPWYGAQEIGNESYFSAYGAITDGTGQRIATMAVSFPDKAYRKTIWILIGVISAAFYLVIIAISIIFLRAGTDIQNRIFSIISTMDLVKLGSRGLRVNLKNADDEIGQLGLNFDSLLNRLEEQEKKQLIVQQIINAEASRRKAIFENERDGLVVVETDGRVHEANPSCSHMLGYSGDEFGGMHVSDWIINIPRNEIIAVLASSEAGGKVIEVLARKKNGSTFDAEISISVAIWGDKKYYLLSQRDVSERKRNLLELQKYRLELENLVQRRTVELGLKSEQLEAIFEISPDGLISFNANDIVTFSNKAFLAMTGLPGSRIIGKTRSEFFDLLRKECNARTDPMTPDFSGSNAARAATSATNEQLEEVRIFDISRPAARTIQMNVRLPASASVSRILYFRDITRQTEIDRMKSEFLSTAAHELRTPMTSIHGFSEVLLKQNVDERTRIDLLETIFRQSELISSIINELLDLARIEARQGKDFRMKRVSVQEIVNNTVSSYKIPPGHEKPTIKENPEELYVMADAAKMQQALMNIISNAYKYMPDKGQVRISLAASSRDDKTFYGIAVSDEGIGMTDEQQKRACERFYRADTSGKTPGTGLGLSIVKEIVEIHGGNIEISSVLHKGSTITLWIPEIETDP